MKRSGYFYAIAALIIAGLLSPVAIPVAGALIILLPIVFVLWIGMFIGVGAIGITTK